MKKQLKVGMFCWMTNCHFPENNGLVVEIKEICDSPSGNNYLASGPMRRYLDVATGAVAYTELLWTKRFQLIPINDPDIDISEIEGVDIRLPEVV